ncbi:hypothetical protein AAFF_G00294170 [Aldrovandia affinis]|uniref:Uncharacterized protein n=1 Tax=Aldrovandia affinis TaxID=143900 RepID=A0AAD7R9K5_9TELE|nr:hypothetical protein AAFF_G00294170 [Aldrovandia affinis]
MRALVFHARAPGVGFTSQVFPPSPRRRVGHVTRRHCLQTDRFEIARDILSSPRLGLPRCGPTGDLLPSESWSRKGLRQIPHMFYPPLPCGRSEVCCFSSGSLSARPTLLDVDAYCLEEYSKAQRLNYGGNGRVSIPDSADG